MGRNLRFSIEEFRLRYATIQSEMAKRDTDLLLLDQPETIFYLLGYAMSEGFQQFCVVPREGLPAMVLRCVDAGTCRDLSWIDDVFAYADWEDPIAVVADLVARRGWSCGRIGVDERSYNLTVQRFRKLQQAFSSAVFSDFSTFLSAQRACKSPAEIAYLRRSSQIADQVLATIREEIKAGDSARDCVALAAQQIIRLGGDAGVVGPVTKSIGDDKMHALIDDDPLKDGDLLHVELIPQYMGYASRLMRPLYMGPAPKHLIETAREIVALNAVPPGSATGRHETGC